MRILLISGSLRQGSTNTAALRTALELARPPLEAVLYDGMAALPHFNPDDDLEGAPVHPAVAALRVQTAAADAIVVCTPEYAGTLPGAFKNLLEWTVGDGGLYGKPVAWINVSGPAAPTAAAGAHDALRTVLGYVGAEIVAPGCGRIPLTRDAITADGVLSNDTPARTEIAAMLAALATWVDNRRSPPYSSGG